MHHLGVPTARALGLITTRQTVMRDMFFDGNTKAEAGAVIWRVAPSLTRSVDFEIVTVRGEIELPRRLVDYTSRADFPHLSAPASPATYVEWFAEVCRPYRFGHQPRIAYWNLVQLANAANPLINEVEPQQTALRVYIETFAKGWRDMMARQRGLEAYRPVTDDDLMTELLFLLYSALNGTTLSSIFLAYAQSSITSTFFVCSATFVACSVYGWTTRRDLTSMGGFLTMGLIGIVIASLVNLFIQSSAVSTSVSYIGVLVFVGLTAYDTQDIKNMAMAQPADIDGGAVRKGAILGALKLYLDFINLFLMLLRIFGSSREE
jgi:hypothetical protein